MRICRILSLPCLVILLAATAAPTLGQGFTTGPPRYRLSRLDISQTQQGWGQPQKDRSVDGNPLTMGGQVFEYGLGTHAESVLNLELPDEDFGGRFTASVGVDDEVGQRGSVNFIVYADGKQVYSSGIMTGGDAPRRIDVPLFRVKKLTLAVTSADDGIDYDHADWANATFVGMGQAPTVVAPPKEEAIILTPKPGPEPRITSARVFGVRPGSPVLYRISATGQKPMGFNVEGLPPGLSINNETGQITGKISEEGDYTITLIARNDVGRDSREMVLKVGDTIALTPPMGWNSWNCWGCAIDAQKIRQAADAMNASGLADHGWQYINIDDCWMVRRNSDDPTVGGATRDETGRILCNSQFPDMKGLTDYVHSQGLKIGLYTSPGPSTCQDFEGAWQHERQDAQRFAQWGFDYLKYDWCGYRSIARNPTLEQLKTPYILMRKCLDEVDRDIVYSLCQYGMGDVWEWGAEVGGNCWRTTGDITDTWGSMSQIGFSQAELAPYASPGHWNDPDMLVVGKVGWGPNLHDSRLTPNEQYTHISLWCLLSSPLLIGCDLTQMDDFTLNLLTNDEVLEVNQDPLGRQATRKFQDGNLEVWAKTMYDGSTAVGLFNRGQMPATATARWSDLGVSGSQRVRDLWRQQDLGHFEGQFEAEVPRHGVVLVRLFSTSEDN